MPAERLPMRKIKEILRLKWGCGFGDRQVAKSCGIARSTVGEYLRRAQKAGLSWPLPEDLTETRVEQLLFPTPPLPSLTSFHRSGPNVSSRPRRSLVRRVAVAELRA